jgi:hypothetical protein
VFQGLFEKSNLTRPNNRLINSAKQFLQLFFHLINLRVPLDILQEVFLLDEIITEPADPLNCLYMVILFVDELGQIVECEFDMTVESAFYQLIYFAQFALLDATQVVRVQRFVQEKAFPLVKRTLRQLVHQQSYR